MPSKTSLLVVAALGTACVFACSRDEERSSVWNCYSVAVPGGRTRECVSSTASGLIAPAEYTCPPDGDYNPNCPPSDTADAGVTNDGTGDGTDGGSICDFCPDCTGCGGGTSDGPGSSSSSGGASDGSSSGKGNGSSSGHGGSSGHASSSGGTSSGGSSSGGTSSGSSGGTSDGDGGFICESEDGITKNCHKPPKCLPGSHPSPCGACVPDTSGTEDCTPPSAGGCWVTGGGFVTDANGKDSFGGNGMPMKSGAIRGEWENQDHGTQSKAHGHVTYLVCRHVAAPGPGRPGGKKGFDINQVYFGGAARHFTAGAWADGYWFDVVAEDHGEPGNTNAHKATADYYHFTLRKIAGPNQSGTVVYETKGDLTGGNIQIHPPNGGHPYTSSQLPAWVQVEP